MDIIDSLKWRYATKKFDNDGIIPQDKVDRIKQAFNLTATSYGMQPIKLLIIKNKSLQEELVEHSFDQQQVALASHLLVDLNLGLWLGFREEHLSAALDGVGRFADGDQRAAPRRAARIDSPGASARKSFGPSSAR